MPKINSTAERRTARRMSYDASFKLKVVQRALEMKNNRQTADHFGVSEKQVRDWIKIREKLASGSKNSKRLTGGGRKSENPVLEDSLVEWLTEQRKSGIAISGKMIKLESLRESSNPDFKASDGWLQKFKRRFGLSTRQRTSIGQKLPDDSEEKLMSFHKFVLSLRRQHEYPLSDIFNMDETPLRFDMPETRTLSFAGEKTVHIKTTGAEKRGFTCVLTVAADGSKVKPLVIFKGKRDPKVATDHVKVTVQEKGWIDESGCSGGMTPVLQPLDVGINKPLKDSMKQFWNEWMISGKAELTKGGKRRPPSKELLVDWLHKSWDNLDPMIIVRSFLKTGIANAMDGTEDDELYGDLVQSLTNELPPIFDSDSEDDEEFEGFTENDM
ncbi:hypothetical protein BOV97_13080 [Solemya velum gill symbiont]|uniref:helix-turn-helix domain-containing protein n=1 Tax=Solemya velum gill symbiont TaxID=2340 RepID=UPI0009978680|nr:helix-turn-helix domain-containing protein [Solemya velum gill symbiont]OOY49140.1 hypothetical protein BOV97_13080 [Solemya velum gill symbiont]